MFINIGDCDPPGLHLGVDICGDAACCRCGEFVRGDTVDVPAVNNSTRFVGGGFVLPPLAFP
jgi:hypothetical protein